MSDRAVLFGDRGWFAFESVEPRRGYTVCTLAITLDGEERRIELDQITVYVADMLGFFEDLASSASSSPPSVTTWESEFAEARVIATRQGEHVRFDIDLWWPPKAGGGSWQGQMLFEARRLGHFVDVLRRLLKIERGSRFIRFDDLDERQIRWIR